MGDVEENALGRFLRARREQVTPADAGLGDDGRRRRVAGLRREELALLAGVSPAYYVRLEQGHSRHPSQQVLDALARALQLDRDATRHLHALGAAGDLGGVTTRRVPPLRPEQVRPTLARMLDHQVDGPAFVLGRVFDVLAANALARALHPSFAPGRNIVHDVFLDDEAIAAYADLDHVRRAAVASLRAAAGELPGDARLTELVGELSLRSQSFRALWARHEVRTKIAGTKHFHHPLVGELELDYESFAVAGTDHQQLIVYHAAPSSPAAESLGLLGAWTTPAHTQRSAP
jgi:transcriptional regulator with XRE-family HTH domain